MQVPVQALLTSAVWSLQSEMGPENVYSLLRTLANGDPSHSFPARDRVFAGEDSQGPGYKDAATNVARRFLAISLGKDGQQQFAFAWNGR